MAAGSGFAAVSLVSSAHRSREFVDLRSLDCTCRVHGVRADRYIQRSSIGGADPFSDSGARLQRFIALMMPFRSHSSTQPAAASSTDGRSRSSSGVKRDSTCRVACPGPRPIPIRILGNASIPSSSMIDLRPLCPPEPPLARSRMEPKGRSMSSTTTSMSASAVLYQFTASRTAAPLKFMYVRGLSSTIFSPLSKTSTSSERKRLRRSLAA
jgi:hypothetical protein